MDLKIKLKSKPDRLSTSTLSALISNFTKAIENSVFESMCSMNRGASRSQIQKSIYGNIHLDIERVEKGSFILFITEAIAGTVASCFYDAVKRRVTRRLSTEEVTEVVNNYLPTIAKNLERDLKSKSRFGSLYVDNIKISLSNENKFPEMTIDVDLGLPEKEHMPIDSESQIEYVIRVQEIKRNRKQK
ncbi:hypothetical protein [Marinobacterium lacunae]|uniref:hypothetical protein n=1 Tax=Marinobacterium lacunae TaxID=1232683 RepID=UPI0012DBD95C|nr:hypothetical protein [Marinobacterium lacunae]